MKRRELACWLAAAPILALAPLDRAAGASSLAPGWRRYALRYEFELDQDEGPMRLWLPVPQDQPAFQRVLALDWSGQADRAALNRDPVYGAPILAVEWSEGGSARFEVEMLVELRDRGAVMPSPAADAPGIELYTRATPSMPTDGKVAATAGDIVHGIAAPEDRARAIYDWIVDNTFRDPRVRGCGTGNIRAMLETGNLGGKCADINSLFVGLARAAGLPAREAFGVRVGESALYRCLGKGGGDVSGAQHCRAEFYTERLGWVPVDPADVRKAVLEEGLALQDARLKRLREQLFGYWEMNWVAFNSARDFALVPSSRTPLSYLMYPYLEAGERSLDGRDPGAFRYRLLSRELGA